MCTYTYIFPFSLVNRIKDVLIESFNNDCHDILADTELRQQVKDLKIDLIVVDVFPLNNCLLMIPHSYGLPFVYVSSVYEPVWSLRIPALPSVFPTLNVDLSEKMNFMERVQNFLIQFTIHVHSGPVLTDYKMIETYRRSDKIHSFLDIIREADFFMFLLDPILNYPIPLYQNMVNIGCATCRENQPLPTYLGEFVSQADHGVLFISFGSAVSSFEDHTVIKIRDALLAVKYHVVWRIKEHEHLKDLPKRIMIGTWFPQNDLLGHHKVTGFLNHGGTNGQYEALYHGVPLITFPIFGDQVNNFYVRCKP